MIPKKRPEEEGPAEDFPENPEQMIEEQAPEEEASEAPEGDAAPEAAPEDAEEVSNVSPEEQKQYDRFVDNCYSVIYDQKTLPKILKSLDATEDPKMNLANTVVTVIDFVAKSAKGAQMEISGDVLMHGGAEVMGDLADLAGKVKIHDYTDDEIEGATYIAMDLYREMQKKDGTLDINAAKEDVRTVMMAEKEGRMGEVLPGVEERFGVKGKPPADEPPAEEEPAEEGAM